jgi:hypothetical protein
MNLDHTEKIISKLEQISIALLFVAFSISLCALAITLKL